MLTKNACWRGCWRRFSLLSRNARVTTRAHTGIFMHLATSSPQEDLYNHQEIKRETPRWWTQKYRKRGESRAYLRSHPSTLLPKIQPKMLPIPKQRSALWSKFLLVEKKIPVIPVPVDIRTQDSSVTKLLCRKPHDTKSVDTNGKPLVGTANLLLQKS